MSAIVGTRKAFSSGGSGGNYRVGRGTNAARWVNEALGVDIDQIGNLTPESVRSLAQKAQKSKQQAMLAKAFVKHFDVLAKNHAFIEKCRLEAIEIGLKTKEEIDNYVSKALVRAASHEAHIKEISQKTSQSVGLIGASSQSRLQLGREAYQQQLRMIQMKHRAGQAGIRASMQDSIGRMQAATRERQAMRHFGNYINSTDTAGKQFKTGFGLGRIFSGLFS